MNRAGAATAGPPARPSRLPAGPAGLPEGPSGREELLRTLGACCLVRPGDAPHLAEAAGLEPWTNADHTDAFVLDLPPYAAIHLGPDGRLGGEAADRAAGVWRVLGLDPPAEPDHLGVILALYAELREAVGACRGEPARERLRLAAATVLLEHLWPWCPGYLDAVAASGPLGPWAGLLSTALADERRLHGPLGDAATPLPLALRSAPPPLDPACGRDGLLDALVAPLRSGIVLTRTDLALAGRAAGAGLRHGERRFILAGLLDQAPADTLAFLARLAAAWAGRHGDRLPSGDPVAAWWASRARRTAAVLSGLAARAGAT